MRSTQTERNKKQTPARNTFVAINFDDAIQEAIAQFQQELALYLRNTRWVNKSQLHLTLLFLNSISSYWRKKVVENVKEMVEEVKPFFFDLCRLGVFPGPKKAKILWLGVQDPGLLTQFNKTLCRRLSCEGIQVDPRPFTPHITLGRAEKGFFPKENIKLLLKKYEKINLGKVKCDSIAIMESELQSKGAVYRVIENIYLSNQQDV